VVARVQNLSTSGVFVTAADLPAAGTEVLCRMLVAGERCTFKGFVAWVRPAGIEGANDGGPGAGIEFIGVSDREAELLARLIQPDVSDRQSVDVWFEGMSAPIKSHASITDDALSISTKLPFLRLNSPVKVSFTRRGVEEERSGILEAVTLEPSAEDGIPRLQLTVSTPLADSAYGTIDVPGLAAGFTPPEGMLVREPRTVVDAATVEETPPPLVEAAPAEAPPDPPSAPVLERRLSDQDRTQRVLRPSEPITLVPPIPVVVSAARPEVGAFTRFAMAIVTLGVVGSLGYLLWDRSEHPVSRADKIAPAETRPRIEKLAVQAATAVERPRPRPVVVQAAAAAPAADKANTPDKAEKSEPAVEAEPGTMAIALIGSAKGMQFYKLADPPGLAINLPHGYPRPGATGRVPGGAFKKLVIQRKGLGSQLRVFFTSEQSAEVAAEPNGLRVIVRAKRAGRKS
jgi:hypothetical protein